MCSTLLLECKTISALVSLVSAALHFLICFDCVLDFLHREGRHRVLWLDATVLLAVRLRRWCVELLVEPRVFFCLCRMSFDARNMSPLNASKNFVFNCVELTIAIATLCAFSDGASSAMFAHTPTFRVIQTSLQTEAKLCENLTLARNGRNQFVWAQLVSVFLKTSLNKGLVCTGQLRLERNEGDDLLYCRASESSWESKQMKLFRHH